MTWLEIFTQIIVPACSTIAGIVGGGAGVYYWRENKALKQAEADKSKAEAQMTTTDARLAEANFAEKILEKYEKSVLARMDSGDAVRKQEFSDLKTGINKRFDAIETENGKQNSLLKDIVEFLNGDFQQFEDNKKVQKALKKVAK